MYPILRVDKNTAAAPEQLGSKYKFWIRDGERRLLFKAEERGTGEDWAEKVTDRLCECLGLPHVSYELAELFDGETSIQPGVVCETCSPPPLALILGNQLLFALDATYPASRKKYKVREHTIEAVTDVVKLLGLPSEQWLTNLPRGLQSAMDIFAGYLLLDAWVANQDRHHENWAAISDEAAMQLRLAPTFDHGAALARNLHDDEREERLKTKDQNRSVHFFAARARSAFYLSATDKTPLTTVQAFIHFARIVPDAGRIWLEKLACIDSNAVNGCIEPVPDKRMSSIAKHFTLELLAVNQRRLLAERI